MGKIWEFFEHLDEYVYVSDPETNQLVYMNQKALKSYGFQSKEEIVGLKCYEVLQGNSAPCSICNNEQLRPGYFKEWEYYNPVVKTDFRIKDTLVEDDGRMLRMEIAIDCGHSGDRETSMDYHKMEAAMNQAIRVALRQETPNQTLEVLLELLGKTMEADRTYIFEKNDHGHWISLTMLIVIQPYFGATRKKGIERIVGTVAGIVLGGAIMLLPLPHDVFVGLLIIVSFFVAYFLRNNYKVGVFFVTIMMVILMQISQQASWELIGWRVLSTLIGALLAVVASYVFWPVWEKKRFPPLMEYALLQNKNY
jgi:hypothetical protein